jgi:hypothetical protein
MIARTATGTYAILVLAYYLFLTHITGYVYMAPSSDIHLLDVTTRTDTLLPTTGVY